MGQSQTISLQQCGPLSFLGPGIRGKLRVKQRYMQGDSKQSQHLHSPIFHVSTELSRFCRVRKYPFLKETQINSEQVLFLRCKETPVDPRHRKPAHESWLKHQSSWLAGQRAEAAFVETQTCKISVQAQKGSCAMQVVAECPISPQKRTTKPNLHRHRSLLNYHVIQVTHCKITAQNWWQCYPGITPSGVEVIKHHSPVRTETIFNKQWGWRGENMLKIPCYSPLTCTKSLVAELCQN